MVFTALLNLHQSFSAPHVWPSLLKIQLNMRFSDWTARWHLSTFESSLIRISEHTNTLHCKELVINVLEPTDLAKSQIFLFLSHILCLKHFNYKFQKEGESLPVHSDVFTDKHWSGSDFPLSSLVLSSLLLYWSYFALFTTGGCGRQSSTGLQQPVRLGAVPGLQPRQPNVRIQGPKHLL